MKCIPIHSIILKREFAPDAQEIFHIFDKDETTHRLGRVMPRSLDEAMQNFTFEAYKITEQEDDN